MKNLKKTNNVEQPFRDSEANLPSEKELKGFPILNFMNLLAGVVTFKYQSASIILSV